MDFGELTKLVKKRAELTSVQDHLMDNKYTLAIICDGNYSRWVVDLLDEEIAKELKLKAQHSYEAKIQEINKEITKLCQEQ